MHTEAREFVQRHVSGRRFNSVLEFGSLDINGSVRDLFDTERYHGIDLVAGPGVDQVADARRYRAEPYDAVVCCEVLEHVQNKVAIIESAAACLRGPGCCGRTPGLFIITCACDPREPHSAVDGGPLREGEFYGNAVPQNVKSALGLFEFDTQAMLIDDKRGDLYVIATKR